MFKIGIIGFGKMGLLHAGILNAFEDSKVIAGADPSDFTLSSLKRFKPDINLYNDHRKMLEAEKLDLIVIATPVSMHAPIALDCIRHKSHVFIEKPLAMNDRECQEIRKALADNPEVRCVAGYCLRYRCTFQQMKKYLDQGILGSIISFQGTMYSSDVYRKNTSWRFNKKESGGGVVTDLGSHLLNIIAWYFKLPEKILATTERWFSDQVEDQVHACMWFKNGPKGWIDSCWSMPNYRLPLLKIHLFGDNGEAIVTNDEISIYLKEERAGIPKGWTKQYAVDLKPEIEFELAEEYYTLQLREAVNYCKGTARHLNGFVLEDPTQIMVDSIYESAKEKTLHYLGQAR